MRSMLLAVGITLIAFGSASAQSSGGGEPPYQISARVSAPVLVSEVKPQYTGGAIRRRVQGEVELKAVVKKDGTVGDVTVSKSLDPELDEQAILAAKQWKFRPGMKDGEAVNVQVNLNMTFTLRDREPIYDVGPGVSEPVVVKRVEAQYPEESRRAGVEGTVALECVVDTKGVPTMIRVTRPLDPDLNLAAMKALGQWQFKPGEKDGKPVRVRINVEISFSVK
jgi:TonB family protein